MNLIAGEKPADVYSGIAARYVLLIDEFICASYFNLHYNNQLDLGTLKGKNYECKPQRRKAKDMKKITSMYCKKYSDKKLLVKDV